MTVISADGRHSFDREDLSSASISEQSGCFTVTARTADGAGPLLMGAYRAREDARAALNDMMLAAGEFYQFPIRRDEG